MRWSKRQSAYASVLGALINCPAVAPRQVDVAADPALDETWEESRLPSAVAVRTGNPVPGGTASATRQKSQSFVNTFFGSIRMNYLDTLLFGYYPYICLAVFFLGSLIPVRPRPIRGRAIRRSCCVPGSCVSATTCFTPACCSCSSDTFSAC